MNRIDRWLVQRDFVAMAGTGDDLAGQQNSPRREVEIPGRPRL